MHRTWWADDHEIWRRTDEQTCRRTENQTWVGPAIFIPRHHKNKILTGPSYAFELPSVPTESFCLPVMNSSLHVLNIVMSPTSLVVFFISRRASILEHEPVVELSHDDLRACSSTRSYTYLYTYCSRSEGF